MDWIEAIARYAQPFAVGVMIVAAVSAYNLGRGQRYHLPRGCLAWLGAGLASLVFVCGGLILVGYALFEVGDVRAIYATLEEHRGKPAPPLQVELMPDRAPAQLSAYRGRVLLLNFWGTWCGPCLKEMPALDALQREHADRGLTVLHVSEEDPDSILRYLDQHPMATSHARVDDLGQDPLPYRLAQDNLPLSFIIDREGRLRASVLGTRALDFYRSALEGHL